MHLIMENIRTSAATTPSMTRKIIPMTLAFDAAFDEVPDSANPAPAVVIILIQLG